jgi:MFS transporter, DHA3 family, macrolide efflux protein
VFHSNQTLRAIILLTILASLLFVWVSFTSQVWIVYTFSILLGFSNAGIRVLRLTYFFKHIPNEIMGRVNSIFNMSNVLTRSLFIFLFSMPFFSSGPYIIWAFFILSVYLGLSGLVLLLHQRKLAP